MIIYRGNLLELTARFESHVDEVRLIILTPKDVKEVFTLTDGGIDDLGTYTYRKNYSVEDIGNYNIRWESEGIGQAATERLIKITGNNEFTG